MLFVGESGFGVHHMMVEVTGSVQVVSTSMKKLLVGAVVSTIPINWFFYSLQIILQ